MFGRRLFYYYCYTQINLSQYNLYNQQRIYRMKSSQSLFSNGAPKSFKTHLPLFTE